MSPIVAFIFALAKAVPEVRILVSQLTEVWAAHQRNQNVKAQAEKDARNDAAVDAAISGARPPGQ